MPIHPTIEAVTGRIARRSRESRAAYLDRIDAARDRQRTGVAAARDGPRAAGGFEQRGQVDRIGVGKPAAGADHRPDADALVDVEPAGLDDAVLQTPGLGLAILEIQIAEIDRPGHQPAEHAIEVVRLELGRSQEMFGCQLQHVVISLGLVLGRAVRRFSA